MAENTHISWATHLCSVVKLMMAVVAKRYPVRYYKAKFRIVRERFNVMSVKIPAAIIAAVLAAEFVANVHVKAPSFIFCAESYIMTFCALSILVGMTGRTANCCSTESLTDFFASLYRVLYPQSLTWDSLFLKTHGELCFCGMSMALESRDPALRAYRSFDPPTAKAFRFPPVIARAIVCEFFSFFPVFTPRASEESGCDAREKLFERQSESSGYRLHRTVVSLWHRRISNGE